ncbi:colanic acid biosynthesis glycosyltransferase WcaL [Anabaena sp. FACHB-709]|uniref:Glycosyltransferase n=2 Tax=Nostocaceae TaxID=1162 RepID=A0A1Z4KP92_ANAVA|nr:MULTISPECIES: colanic acid biosynthesis glycosyltransferase WcaL [Nostocaceae]BAY70799.1 glycosyltransferase [Trichormus variabilis NIES-23]HBW33809.1 colanic acid biosynthesis glycosyltransferase WcaL [Nostoc sp. UBA8866]MBD2171208.1 colanic acid biosynthesis glycosyltransferase WcaL [Anabaena cylindrica FACHB-318]MBD2263122.1 colanic acid biosynthesis glycosyltransferase WcaL [Anabaena sp. FACHB-709]MBD2272535.1 colanic acid biosynthesis glycosyltransferase WcaL [Nostoc sp. PCC 7120 = FAC
MKVAFIVWRFPVLSEAFILNQITGLIDRGHEVCIHPVNGLPKDYTGKLHPVVEEYRLMERVCFPPHVPNNLIWRFFKGVGLFIRNIHQGSCKTWRFFIPGRYGKEVATLKTFYRIVGLLKDGSYDIIHCQFGTLAPIALAYREVGIISGKLITTFRGIDISKYVEENGIDVYEQLFQEGEFFLANCQFFGDRAINLGCNPDKLIIHGSGLDCNKFTFKPRYFPADGKVQVATTGRLVEKKGIEYAIRAVAKVAELYPNIEYQVIGDGDLKEDLEQLITELNIGHIVKLLGWKQQKEIVEILENTHIFIAPSVTAADGNQDAPVNTLKEAMAMGLPVISTRHGGIPELVTDGVSGFLVPERDAEAIAHKLTYLIEHPELWEEMGKAGRGRVAEKYDMNKLNDELVEIYQQMLKSASPQQDLQHLPKELTAI